MDQTQHSTCSNIKPIPCVSLKNPKQSRPYSEQIRSLADTFHAWKAPQMLLLHLLLRQGCTNTRSKILHKIPTNQFHINKQITPLLTVRPLLTKALTNTSFERTSSFFCSSPFFHKAKYNRINHYIYTTTNISFKTVTENKKRKRRRQI